MGAHKPLELCDERGLIVSFGDSASSQGMELQEPLLSSSIRKVWGAVKGQIQHSQLPGVELQLLGWLFLNFLQQPLVVSMGRGGSWGAGSTEFWHLPYGTSQMGQMGSINWLIPHHALTTLFWEWDNFLRQKNPCKYLESYTGPRTGQTSWISKGEVDISIWSETHLM